MNSALKPSVLPTSGASQTPQAHSKPMHPQGAPSFGQPSGHVTQNPFPNMNVAHNHPNAQQNHFGMGGASHFNMGNIPASNHPVASINQTSAGQQIFGSAAKNLGYPGSFQGNLAHQQNQNTIPPISQTLPATSQPTQLQQSPVNIANSTSNSAQQPEVQTEQPQSNGTSENKPEVKENHVSPQLPQQSQQPVSITPEKPKPPPVVQEEKPPPEPQVVKPPEEPAVKEPPQPAPVPETTESPMEDNEASSPDTESPTIESKASEDTNSPMDVEPDTEKETPQAVACKEEEKVSVPEDTDKLVEKKKTTASDESSSQQVAEEKAKEEVKTETDKVAVEAPEPAKSRPKELSPPKKDVKEAPIKSNTPKTPARKPRLSKTEETKTPKPESKTPTAIQKSPSIAGKVKRQRIRTQHYQSPLPEIEIITKISSSTPRSKTNDEKLIYFYKNEFLAVRNAEGGFYLCQAVQNIYKSSSKIKIRWLSQDKNDKSGEIYTPDFYDLTDFDCILTSLDLSRVDKGKFRLSAAEKERTDSILKRCLAVEKGEISTPSISEEHPDGLDLSLYKDEEQLKKNKRGAKRKSHSPTKTSHKATPVKKSPEAPKVRKVEAVKTPAKKATPKKPTTTPAKKATPAPPPPAENKKSPATTSRLSRGKRKSDTKSSPVVDQKKAKVLAKIGKKAAVAASTSRSQPSKTKNVNVTKTTPAKQATKPAVATPTRPSSARKIKRSGGK